MKSFFYWLRDEWLFIVCFVGTVSLLSWLIIQVGKVNVGQTIEHRQQLYEDWCVMQQATNLTFEQWDRLREANLLHDLPSTR